MLEQKCWINGSVFFGIDPMLVEGTNNMRFWLEGRSVNFIFVRRNLGNFLGFF